MEAVTVYVLMDHDIESDEVLGVFASREAAQAAIDEAQGEYERLRRLPDPTSLEGWLKACRWSRAEIHEWEVLA